MFKNNKGCCERLIALHKTDKKFGINFRIINNSKSFRIESEKRGINLGNNNNFMLTEGYEQKLSSSSSKVLLINNCPFCGKSLIKYYSDKKWINELNHEW